MNGLETQFRKNPIEKKNEKTAKLKLKLPHVNKKPLARKRIFVQTPFSHSTLKLTYHPTVTVFTATSN